MGFPPIPRHWRKSRGDMGVSLLSIPRHGGRAEEMGVSPVPPNPQSLEEEQRRWGFFLYPKSPGMEEEQRT